MKSAPRFSFRPAGSVFARGFTLVELLVSTAVLSVLLMVTLSALDTMQRSWKQAKGKVNQFREARIAFETITRNLSQATLNTYWDYHYTSTGSNAPPKGSIEPPVGYVRQSELDFRILPSTDLVSESGPAELPGHGLFFQAPLGHSQNYRGLSSLLNARGYYVRFRSNEDQHPSFMDGKGVPVKYRYQLMEYRPPAEQVAGAEPSVEGASGEAVEGNAVYAQADWYRRNLDTVSRPIADNILLLIVSPLVPKETLQTQANPGGTKKDPWWIAPGYLYRSRDANMSTPEIDPPTVAEDGTISQGTRHLLPPLVRVTLVAGDEESLSRWISQRGNTPLDISQEAEAPFLEARHHERDLGRLKQYLDDQRLNYRVFTATVPLRNAAWDSTTY